jgi:hypothetical protein
MVLAATSANADPAVPATNDGPGALLSIPHMAPVHIQPLRAPGRRAMECRVRLKPANGPAQQISLIGTGETEALSCQGIKAFGTVDRKAPYWRIAFIYRTSSPNYSSLTPVILYRTRQSPQWRIDDALGQKLGERPQLDTIARMRLYFARGTR